MLLYFSVINLRLRISQAMLQYWYKIVAYTISDWGKRPIIGK